MTKLTDLQVTPVDDPLWQGPTDVRQGLFFMEEGQRTRLVLTARGLVVQRGKKTVGIEMAELLRVVDATE